MKIKLAVMLATTATFIFFLYAIYRVIIVENRRFEASMLILIGLTLLGFLSLVYHAKTLRFYKDQLPSIKLGLKFLWVTNLVYAFILFVFSLVLIYSLYTFYIRDMNINVEMRTNYLIPALIAFFTFLVSIFLAIEASALYKRFKSDKNENVLESIDDIKGQQED